MQDNIKQSIGELLESSFKPELFLLGITSSAVPIVGAIAAGAGALCGSIHKSKKDKYTYAALFNATNLVDVLLAGWNSISKSTDYKEAVNQYNNIIDAVNVDFKKYKEKHEEILQSANQHTLVINRKKTLMKEYLLKDLYDSLKKCGLAGEYYDMNDEYLDLRMWPINKQYDLVNQRHLSFIETFGFSGSSSKKSAILDLFFDLTVVTTVYVSPLKRLVLRRNNYNKLKKEIADLEQQVKLNKEDMLSDLEKLHTMDRALKNIAGIYSSVLDTYKPIMQKIFLSLEIEYENNVSALPEGKITALFTISRLLKELSEKRILPCTEDPESIHRNICDYSNNLTKKYNQLYESVKHNFC